MGNDRPEVGMKVVPEQRINGGKPLIFIEPSTASRALVETLRSVLPDVQKHHVQYVNLDKIQGNSESELVRTRK